MGKRKDSLFTKTLVYVFYFSVTICVIDGVYMEIIYPESWFGFGKENIIQQIPDALLVIGSFSGMLSIFIPIMIIASIGLDDYYST